MFHSLSHLLQATSAGPRGRAEGKPLSDYQLFLVSLALVIPVALVLAIKLVVAG